MNARNLMLLACASFAGTLAVDARADGWSTGASANATSQSLNGTLSTYIPTLTDQHFADAMPGPLAGSVMATTGSAARGSVTYGSSHAPSAQAGDSSASGLATVGGLRAIAGADNSVADFTGYIGYSYLNASYSNSAVNWTDTVTFHTSNPLGVDYVVTSTLADSLSTSLVPSIYSNNYPVYPTGTRSFAWASNDLIYSSTDTRVSNNFGSLYQFDQFMETTADRDPVTGIPIIQQSPPPNPSLSTTIHVFDGTTFSFNQSLSVHAEVDYGSGTAGADAGDTAYFNLSTTDPDASYSTASGTVFAVSGDPFGPTSVPEPSEVGLLSTGLGAGAWWLRRRRRDADDR